MWFAADGLLDGSDPVANRVGRLGYAGPVAAGVWRSLRARFVRDEEAVGSNPATPTRMVFFATSAKQFRQGRLDVFRPADHQGLRRSQAPFGFEAVLVLGSPPPRLSRR